MKKRIIGGAIVLGVSLPCLLIGGIVFNIFALLVAGFALVELINADKDLRNIPNIIKAISFVSIPLIAICNFNGSFFVGIDMYSFLIPVAVLMILPIFTYKKGYGMNEAFKLTFVSIFVSLICLSFVTVMSLKNTFLFYLIIIAVATDVFAYLGGRTYGKHKFTEISPNKTIEGCVTGAIFGTAAGFAFYTTVIGSTNAILILGITLLLSIIGEIGDLIFSLIKRENSIKDYSKLIPGHGGICDRIDSLSFIVIVFLIIFKFI